MLTVSRVAHPIRLPVEFPTARALLADYARSLGQGGIAAPSFRSLTPGARFLFEMRAPGMQNPVLAPAAVRWARSGPASPPGARWVGIEYAEPEAADPGIEEALTLVARDHRAGLMRRYVRYPAYLPVRGPLGRFRMRDVGRLGFGFEVEDGHPLAGRVATGQRLRLEIRRDDESLPIAVRVAWSAEASAGPIPALAAFGVCFERPDSELRALVDRFIRLRGLPRFLVMF